MRLAHGVAATHALLAAATVVLAALFALAAIRVDRRGLTAAGVGLVLAVLPAATAYVFVQLLENDEWASRPLTRMAKGIL